MNTFEIRHRYFFTNIHYFVETELCLEDFNWLIAYVQIIHCQECPSYQPQCEVEDCIWPDNGIHIIHRLYGFKVWAEAEPKIGFEPPRVSRRPNFLREYPNEKYLLT